MGNDNSKKLSDNSTKEKGKETSSNSKTTGIDTEQSGNDKKEQNKDKNESNNRMNNEKPQVIKEVIKQLTKEEALIDRSYGCVIGAAIGDSIGSFCEFRRNAIDDDELDEAMRMPGGGTWGQRVITGQVTDDTELAISLAYGLIDIIGKTDEMGRVKSLNKKQCNESIDENKEINNDENNYKFNLRPIAIEYKRWMDSRPFDIGICTRQTLRVSPNVKAMKENAGDYNKSKKTGNQANGAMMRCMPLAIYGYKLDNEILYKLMKEDASLTHANMAVYLSNTCYAIMIKYLLTAETSNEKRNIQAFDEVFEFLETIEQTTEENSQECKAAQLLRYDWLSMFTNDKVRNTGNYNSVQLNELHHATNSQGWVKIALQRCCYHLLKGNTFKNTLRSVVGEGGDTDTNACIVGGLMGAYWGLQAIPNQYVENIKNCSPTWDANRDKFQAKWYFKDRIVELLIKNAPTDHSFQIDQNYEK